MHRCMYAYIDTYTHGVTVPVVSQSTHNTKGVRKYEFQYFANNIISMHALDFLSLFDL